MIPAETRARAVEMYADGMGCKKVADELGVGKDSVLRWAREDGIDVRTTGRPSIKKHPVKRVRHRDYAKLTEVEIALTGGRWVNVRGVQRWMPDPPPRPVATLLACSCGATLADPCDHQNRVVSRRCPCGNRPPEGQDYCTTECRDDAERVRAA